MSSGLVDLSTVDGENTTENTPEIKRVTLHPLKADGSIDLDINLYPKTLIDGIVDREGKPVKLPTQEELDQKQDLLIAGENITIEGNVISSTGGGIGTEYVINITELDQLEHPVSQEQGEEIFEIQPDYIHLIYNVNVDLEDITVHLNGDAYWSKQINLHQEISDSDETKEYENAIVYTLLSDDTLNAIKIDKSLEGEITVNDMAEWNFSSIVESLAGKADNDEVVHLNSDETINGTKIFSQPITIDNSNVLYGKTENSEQIVPIITYGTKQEGFDLQNIDTIYFRDNEGEQIDFAGLKYTDASGISLNHIYYINDKLLVPNTNEWSENKTIAVDEDVAHKGSSESPSNEDIYGTKTFKYGTIKVDGGDRFATIGPDRFIANDSNTDTEYCTNFIWRVLNAETTPESTFLYFPNKGGTFATTDDVDNSVQDAMGVLAADIVAERDRALAAETALSGKDTQYFSKFLNDSIDVKDQINYDEVAYCVNGYTVAGSAIPSTLTINLTQSTSKATYLEKIRINYIDKNGDAQEYNYTFTTNDFKLNGTANLLAIGVPENLGGLTWTLLNGTAVGEVGRGFSKPTGYSNSCLQAGTAAKPAKYLSLNTDSLAGCTITSVELAACGASSSIITMTVIAANDEWWFNSGSEQTLEKFRTVPASTTAVPWDGAYIKFTNEPDGTTLGEGTTINFTETFLTKQEDSGEPNDIIEIEPVEDTLYVNNTDNIIYRFNGTTLEVVSKTLELGTTSSTAYRGDYGQQNYNDISTLKTKVNGLISAKPKSKTIQIETTDWDTELSYTVDLDPVTVGANDVLFVFPDDSCAEDYYDSGITKSIDGAGTHLTLTATTAPAAAIEIQIVYIACAGWND